MSQNQSVTPPFLVQEIFDILGGIGPDPRNLSHMIAMADSLLALKGSDNVGFQ